MYIIEDDLHAALFGEFASFEQAAAELQRLATLPWDQLPNRPPCTSWATCGRAYEVVEYDTAQQPWRELSRVPVLSVSAAGVIWEAGFPASTPRA